jgi:hypothetical protein
MARMSEVELTILERFKVGFEVSLRTLTPRPDRVRIVLERSACWGELKQVRSCFLYLLDGCLHFRAMQTAHVFADNEEAYTVRSTTVLLGVVLRFWKLSVAYFTTKVHSRAGLTVGDALHDAGNRDGPSVQHPGGHGLLSHEVAVPVS